jgi:hypothetical protein
MFVNIEDDQRKTVLDTCSSFVICLPSAKSTNLFGIRGYFKKGEVRWDGFLVVDPLSGYCTDRIDG